MAEFLVSHTASDDGKDIDADDAAAARYGLRHGICFLAFLGLVVDYMLRVAMSTAAQAPPKDSDTQTMYTEFGWSDFEQGLALSSFYVGYTLLQVPGAMLAATRFGPCRTVLIGIAGAGTFTALTPIAADMGFGGLVAVRVLTGLSEAVVYPALSLLIKAWAPPRERALLGTICWSGAYVGTLIALPLSAAITDSPVRSATQTCMHLVSTIHPICDPCAAPRMARNLLCLRRPRPHVVRAVVGARARHPA
jgi:MFS family permease